MSSIWSKLINLAGNITGTLGTANGGTGLATIGTANQVLGVNSGATGLEYKTMATGTAGSDFAVAFAANSVTYNLPDAAAAARGAVTTGTQTMAGAKTWNDVQVWKFTGGTTQCGSYDTTGAWFRGPTAGVTTYHTDYGSVISRVTSVAGSGSFAGPSASYFSANTYLDNGGTEKAVTTGTGYSYVQMLATTTATNPVCTLFSNVTSQTAGNGTTGSATTCFQILANGTTTFNQIHNIGAGNIRSGSGTTTGRTGTNVTACTIQGQQYLRIGNVVTVSGTADLTITTAVGTASQCGLDLPIASNFTNGNQCSGTIAIDSGATTGYSAGYITSDATNDRCLVSFNALASGAHTMQYTYTYQVL